MPKNGDKIYILVSQKFVYNKHDRFNGTFGGQCIADIHIHHIRRPLAIRFPYIPYDIWHHDTTDIAAYYQLVFTFDESKCCYTLAIPSRDYVNEIPVEFRYYISDPHHDKFHAMSLCNFCDKKYNVHNRKIIYCYDYNRGDPVLSLNCALRVAAVSSKPFHGISENMFQIYEYQSELKSYNQRINSLIEKRTELVNDIHDFGKNRKEKR